MPTKVWAPFERLLSTDMNTFLGQQVVSTFATPAARDTALPTPATGQTCWLLDRGLLQVFSAGAWRSLIWAGGAPSATLYSPATQAISNVGNIGVTSLTAVGHDTHGFALGNSALTIPANMGGVYAIHGELLYGSGGTANTLMAIILLVAGAQYSRADTTNTTNGGGVQAFHINRLTAGQVISLQARQTAAASLNILAGCRLALHWVGD